MTLQRLCYVVCIIVYSMHTLFFPFSCKITVHEKEYDFDEWMHVAEVSSELVTVKRFV